MSILWLAAICAALGIGCLLTPWHIGMTGVCLLLLAAVMTACHFLRGEKWKRWRRVLWSLAALGMALVFGMMGFIALDGRDNAPEEDVPFVVVLGAQTHGDRPSRTLRERLDLAAEYLEAHPAARVIVSGGQRQAIALLMSTMTPIDFLILDEHTAALDPKTAELIMKLTGKIVEEKKLTTIMVTHNLRYAVEYGNRLLMMHQGGVVMDLKGKEKEELQVEDILSKFNEISIECGN